jgi:hypothetical protein
MQQHNPNLDLMTRNLIDLAQEAGRLRNRSSIYVLRRLYAIEREYVRRIEQQQEVVHAQKEAR